MRLRRARRLSRGVASYEALVALPFFILILAGVTLVRDRQLAIQAAENQARSCAWLYSASDCTSIPSGCEGVLRPGTAPRPATQVDDVLRDAKSQVLAGGDAKGVIEKVAVALLGPAIDALFGRYLAGSANRNVTRPGLFGGGQTVVEGRYHLACNLHPTTPEDVVDDVWSKLIE
ncbi:MAG TPA: hypothetical protein VJV79_12675 [Polyangiaceae bacterium]|nr:hypothetical protein [Polyangiaceae bacterium]